MSDEPKDPSPEIKATPSSDIGLRLARLANHLMDRILDTGDDKDQIPIEQETAAFKAVTSYYAIMQKLKPDPDDKDEKGFNGWHKTVASMGGEAAEDEPDF